jgi:hypothetical protein
MTLKKNNQVRKPSFIDPRAHGLFFSCQCVGPIPQSEDMLDLFVK